MKRVSLVLMLAALALPATALGKGPTGASIEGPGGGDGITFTAHGESGGTPLGHMPEQAGFFPAVFAQEPDPMLSGRPKDDLGPKYTVTYTVPGPNNEVWKIRQDVYPYATPAPVTYMKPGQTIFEVGGGTRGGWFQAGPELKDTLVSAGLPHLAPTGSSDGTSFPTVPVSILGLALLFISATALRVRRRTRPAAA